MADGIPYCDPVACPAAGCDPVVCRGAALGGNATAFERSTRVIPGGVNSSIRAFKAVGGTPYLVRELKVRAYMTSKAMNTLILSSHTVP